MMLVFRSCGSPIVGPTQLPARSLRTLAPRTGVTVNVRHLCQQRFVVLAVPRFVELVLGVKFLLAYIRQNGDSRIASAAETNSLCLLIRLSIR